VAARGNGLERVRPAGPLPHAPDRCAELEAGGVVHLADRSFHLNDEEMGLLAPAVAAGEAKNVSLNPATGEVRGAAGVDSAIVAGLLKRFSDWARDLVVEMAPSYGPQLRRGRASFRPRAAAATPLSPRKDDQRLHADAFPSSPTGGKRILRVFCNINPAGEPRVWRVGEPFEDYARRWIGRTRRMWPLEGRLLASLGVTRGRRTPYDALMLSLHDQAKLDPDYQARAPWREMVFPAHTSWIVFTDAVVHAAVAGRWALEQTFYLPVEAMADPAASPLRVLERLTGRRLV